MRERIIDAIYRAVRSPEDQIDTRINKNEIQLEEPDREEFGDYSSNIALQAWGRVPPRSNIQTHKYPSNISGKSSKEFARNIVDRLRQDESLAKFVEKIEVVGPGFINFFLSRNALVNEISEIEKEKEAYGSSNLGEGKTVVIDYSSPNIAKRFGIGHLRSTVIGQALYNLYKFIGYKTIGDNHLGDWGTQFGTLLYQINSKGLSPKELTIDELEKLYVEFNSEAEKDKDLWEKAKEEFKKLEEKDPKNREIWKEIVVTSLKEFDRIYKILGVKIDNSYGESFYEDKMPEIIEEVRKKVPSKKSEGAEIVEFKNMPPAILIKSDGTTTYFTRDLATLKFRIREWDPKIIIYEVGSDQTLHFRQVFAIADLLGWSEDRKFVHVSHGLIRFVRGKMSTRKGEGVKLEEVLDEAVSRAKGIIEKSETGRGLTESEKEKVAQAVGVGAAKYFDLMHHPSTDIIFDWEEILNMEGNSGPYLQYTVARTNSVIQKAPALKGETLQGGYSDLNDEELSLLRGLFRFEGIISLAAKNYSPNLLANYLFDLAQKYNNFYNNHRIIGSENQAFRLKLTGATRQVLKNGLTLLGIETPERM